MYPARVGFSVVVVDVDVVVFVFVMGVVVRVVVDVCGAIVVVGMAVAVVDVCGAIVVVGTGVVKHLTVIGFACKEMGYLELFWITIKSKTTKRTKPIIAAVPTVTYV